MKRTYVDYLNDIIQNCDKAARFLGDADLQNLLDDEKKAYAVVRALEIIGEAASHIPKELRKQYSEILWDEAINMRHRIAHDYFGVDYNVVLDTVQQDLPVLREQVSEMLAELSVQGE